MAKNYTITKEEGIKRMCEAIREAYAISDAIDDEHLATNSTFSSAKINSLLSDIDTRVDKLENSIGSGSGSGGNITIDDALSDTSKNPVQNKVVTKSLSEKALKAQYDDYEINIGRKADTIVGDCSVAIGLNTEASGLCSFADGRNTIASGDYSCAEGFGTEAIGSNSHAEGLYTKATGSTSHAGGSNCETIGSASFAHGHYLTTNRSCETAFGIANQSNEDTLFSIGDGYEDIGENGETIVERNNAFEITVEGGKLHGKDIATTDMLSLLQKQIDDLQTAILSLGGNV